MDGFQEYREAVRQGIEAAGGEPVLVEDLPSLPVSSRTACLDLVASCDLYLAVIGERGGWTTPAGKLVVEEEFEEAQRRNLPVLVFLRECEQDENAKRLAQRLSDYVGGFYRKTFQNPADLINKVRDALAPHLQERAGSVAYDKVSERLTANPTRQPGETQVHFVLAPERDDEVVDPVTLEERSFRDGLFAIGHKHGVDLFAYEQTKEVAVHRSSVEIVQRVERRSPPNTRLELTTDGVVDLTVPLRDDQASPTFDAASHTLLSVILEAEVREAVKRCFAFTSALYDDLDPYGRHARFSYNVALKNTGYKAYMQNPPQGTSVTMRMFAPDTVLAFATPRAVSRNDLQNYASQIEAVVTLFRRQMQNSS